MKFAEIIVTDDTSEETRRIIWGIGISLPTGSLRLNH
jgi:hypothetical protein